MASSVLSLSVLFLLVITTSASDSVKVHFSYPEPNPEFGPGFHSARVRESNSEGHLNVAPAPLSPIPVAPPSPMAPPSPIPVYNHYEKDDALDYTLQIQDLVNLTRSTLIDMGEIAFEDNSEVGLKIVTSLNEEVSKAGQILIEFSSNPDRVKRDVNNNGKEAFNKVGGILVGSNDKIGTDKKQLSSGAQKRLNKKHREGVQQCGADSCRAALQTLQAAEDAENERQ